MFDLEIEIFTELLGQNWPVTQAAARAFEEADAIMAQQAEIKAEQDYELYLETRYADSFLDDPYN